MHVLAVEHLLFFTLKTLDNNNDSQNSVHTLIWSSTSILSEAIIGPASSARTVKANDTPVSFTPS